MLEWLQNHLPYETLAEGLVHVRTGIEALNPAVHWFWGGCAAGGLFAILALRRARMGRQIRRLRRPLHRLPAQVAARLPWRETAAIVGGATVLDLLSAMVRIDPLMLDAIDRAHGSAAFDDFFALQSHILEVSSRGAGAFEGLVSQYKGALGEAWAARYLDASGHSVAFADGPTQAGWDLWVDGMPLQIKSGVASSGVSDALERYPDVSILAVSDHAGHFTQAPVDFLPWSGHAVEGATRESLDAIEGVGDLGFELPVITLGAAAMRNHRLVQQGRMSADEAVVRTVAETAAVGVGAKVGATVGSFIFPGIGTFVGSVLGAILARGALGDTAHVRRIDQRALDLALHDLCLLFGSFACEAHTVATARLRNIDGGMRKIRSRRRWLARLLVRRSDVAAHESLRRLRFERDELVQLAGRLAGVRTANDAARVWAAPLPVLAGLRHFDDAVRVQQQRVVHALHGHPAPDLGPLMSNRGARPWDDRNQMQRPLATAPGLLNAWWMLALPATALAAALLANDKGLLAKAQAAVASRIAEPTSPTADARSAGRRSKRRDAAAPRGGPQPAGRRPEDQIVAGSVPSGTTLAARKRCRLRASAGFDGDLIAILDPDTRCTLIAWEGAWAQAECAAQPVGYVHQDCLARPAAKDPG